LRGYGPLQELLEDETVSEIMVNGPRNIYVERHGKVERSPKVFYNDAHVMRIIEKIISPLGRRLDESVPMVDARLPDGSRVNIIIPPVVLCGPTITIRKFAAEAYTAQDLVNFGTMTEEMCQFLRACVEAHLNILVSGSTSSGKTTTLNVLSSFIPHNERIVTIEDAAELQLQQEHVVPLESRPPNIEGRGEITIRQLVRNALRMRPDRIVVGECRGGEALDMLQAMNTGHDGSLTTIHANGPRDSLSRLETLVLMAGTELPSRAIREQISAALDLIIHQASNPGHLPLRTARSGCRGASHRKARVHRLAADVCRAPHYPRGRAAGKSLPAVGRRQNVMSLGVLVGAACLLVFIAVTMLVLGWRSGQEASPRIEQVVESIEGEGAAAVPRAAGRDVSPLLTRLLDRIGLSRKLQWMLLRSGMLLKPSELAAIGLVTAGIIGSVTTVLTHNAVIGGLVSGAGLVAPWLYVGYRIRCRRAALEGQLAEALDLIASSLRTGYSFMRALQVVINEMKPPITEELQWVLDEISVGIAMDEALERLATPAG